MALEIVKLLLKCEGINVNKNEGFDGPLMYAAQNGHLEIVKLLFEQRKDINVNMPGVHGKTALIYAVENGHLEIVKLLIKKGADVNFGARHGIYALSVAAAKGYADVVKLLIENGAEIDNQDDSNITALMLAAENDYADVVELLIKNGAKLNAQDNSKKTALMLAAENGHLEIVKLLIEKGAAFVVTNIDKYDISAIDIILDTWGMKFFIDLFKDSYLTYKHTDEYVLSKLKEIYSKLEGDNQKQFIKDLLDALKDDSFATYRLYNLNFGTEEDLSNSIQKDLNATEYHKLFSIGNFFYSIWHFLEELICPIWGDEPMDIEPNIMGDS